MSHWTKVKTNISDKETLLKALTKMGLEHTEGDFTISEYQTTAKAEIQLSKSVGLAVQADGTYAMVGDFYHAPRDHKLFSYYNRTEKFVGD